MKGRHNGQGTKGTRDRKKGGGGGFGRPKKMDGWVGGWMDREKPGGNQRKTDGVMDCWPKGIGPPQKSTEFDRKSIKIDGWVMARSSARMRENRCAGEKLI